MHVAHPLENLRELVLDAEGCLHVLLDVDLAQCMTIVASAGESTRVEGLLIQNRFDIGSPVARLLVLGLL